METLEQTVEKSFLGKVKNNLRRVRDSVAGKVTVYSLAGILSAGLGYGCGESKAIKDAETEYVNEGINTQDLLEVKKEYNNGDNLFADSMMDKTSPELEIISTICGNGIRESGEECDGEDFGGLTCSSFQADAVGYLKCNNDCTLNAENCGFKLPEEKPPEELPEGTCPPGVECSGAGNIIGDLDWVDTTKLSPSGKQKKNSKASGKITYTKKGEERRCSATIISNELIITNHHCAPNSKVAETTKYFPTTESNVPYNDQVKDSFACPKLVATDCSHDVSILKCLPHPSTGLLPGEAYGTVKLELDKEFKKYQQVYLIHTNCDHRDKNGDGYPDYCKQIKLLSPGIITSYGKVCITFKGEEACENCRSDAPQAKHTCDSLGGSSGGGIYDAETHKLIGLNWGSIDMLNDTGGWNYSASLAHLADSNPVFKNIFKKINSNNENPCYDFCFEPYPACANINGIWSCVQCCDPNNADECFGGDTYCTQNGGTCDIKNDVCKGMPYDLSVICTGDCTKDGCPPSANYKLACNPNTGCCYDKNGSCDNIEAFCNFSKGSKCISISELFGGEGFEGLPGMPGMPGLEPGFCTCKGLSSEECQGSSMCVPLSILELLGIPTGVYENVCMDLSGVMP